MIHGLLFGEARDWRQHAKSITAQQDEILGVGSHTWNPGVVDVVDRI